MAHSRYEYVKKFEKNDNLLPFTYIVIRIDGRGFHRFSNKYEFEKPNDRRALSLMNTVAIAVMEELPDITMAYGVSDEYSFIFDKNCTLFERRESKLVTTVVSTFTAHYVHQWAEHFPQIDLSLPLPTFDGRAIIYPNTEVLRDYMSWRQVDCHINNLYNTTFWALVQRGGMSHTEAEGKLKGTMAADKNEILFSKFGVNYNKEEELFKKGSVIYRKFDGKTANEDNLVVGQDDRKGSKSQAEITQKRRKKASIIVEHTDIIKDDFWDKRPWLLHGNSS